MLNKKRYQAGFTLIELLVVFGIMALVIGLVPVAMDKMREGAQYRETVRAVLGQMRLARETAVSSGRSVQFVVDVEHRRYGLGPEPSIRLPDALEMKAVVGILETEQPQNPLSIRFLPTGGSSGGSIQILRKAGSGVRLRVDWLSGRVTQEALLP